MPMQEPLMCLEILPFRVFLEREGVSRIVAETPSGSFGILPRRLDCTATVVPGIFSTNPATKANASWRSTRACWLRRGLT